MDVRLGHPGKAKVLGSLVGDYTDGNHHANSWHGRLYLVRLQVFSCRQSDSIDHYRQKPSSFMRNIVAGTKYLEHVGIMRIDNKTNAMRCEVEFQEAGMWGKANVVNATVYSQRGRIEAKMEGKWHESMTRIVSRNQLEVLWRANDLPLQAQDYYGFTYFTMTLNEITEDLRLVGDDGKTTIGYKIPVTDSRRRPDQRALEEGKVDEADKIKLRVEEKQRARRRAGKEVKPRWFTKTGDDDTSWVYAGGYWETRQAGWGQQDPLW